MFPEVLLLPALLLSFAYSGLEGALLAVSRVRVLHAARGGDRRAARLSRLLADRAALLDCLTVVNHVVNLLAFVLMFLPWMSRLSPGRIALMLAMMVPFLLVVEVLPKKIFRRFPFRLLRSLWPLVWAAGLLRPLMRCFRPVSQVSQGEGAMPVGPFLSETSEDLRAVAVSLRQQGKVSAATARLVGRSLDFPQVAVVEVMRPLGRSLAIAADLPLRSVLPFFTQSGLQALPVIDERGHLVGQLDIAAVAADAPEDRLVRQFMRALDQVDATQSAFAALRTMRRRARSLALVRNAAGEPCGLIHHEDLLRQLFATGQPIAAQSPERQRQAA